MSDRLSLLRAILASPDDDVPRLVFADWLEENGTTDADAARVEFIRLGCKMKSGKRPISGDQVAWLVKNWPRLLPSTLSLAAGGKPLSVRRKGRFFALRLGWEAGGRVETSVLHPDFVRGFARRVQFVHRRAYDRFWRAVAADEPLAVLSPYYAVSGGVYPHAWGADVFARVSGFDAEGSGWKQFRSLPQAGMSMDRARQAIADAMTALAREANGLTPNPSEVA